MTSRTAREGEYDNPIDFSKHPRWHGVAYDSTPEPALLKQLDRWLKNHPNAFVRLYHGTQADFPILEQGLLPTSAKRRNSLQSRNGYVSLSIYPGMAKVFAETAFPGKAIQVYEVTLTVSRLVPDKDQLKNKRLYGGLEGIRDTLAHSLAYGHGAQVKGGIDRYALSVYREPPASPAQSPSEAMTSTALHERALGCLQAFQEQAVANPATYQKYAQHGYRTVQEVIEGLAAFIEFPLQARNPDYQGHADATAHLILLASDHPDFYAKMFADLANQDGEDDPKTVQGLLKLHHLLHAILDDHEYILDRQRTPPVFCKKEAVNDHERLITPRSLLETLQDLDKSLQEDRDEPAASSNF